LLVQRKKPKKARPGAADCFLRFSPKSALASTRRALNNAPRAQTRGSLLPILAAMLGGAYGCEKQHSLGNLSYNFVVLF
jgi:hypothetical protein